MFAGAVYLISRYGYLTAKLISEWTKRRWEEKKERKREREREGGGGEGEREGGETERENGKSWLLVLYTVPAPTVTLHIPERTKHKWEEKMSGRERERWERRERERVERK